MTAFTPIQQFEAAIRGQLLPADKVATTLRGYDFAEEVFEELKTSLKDWAAEDPKNSAYLTEFQESFTALDEGEAHYEAQDTADREYEAYVNAPCETCGKPRNKHRRYSRYTSPANGCPEFREPSIEKSFACLRCGVESESRTTFNPDRDVKTYCADCLFETGLSTEISVKHAACSEGKCWQCKGLLTPVNDPRRAVPHTIPCSDCIRKNIDAQKFRHLDLLEDFYNLHPDKRLPEPEPGPLSNCLDHAHVEDVDLGVEGMAIAAILSALNGLPEVSLRRVMAAVDQLTTPFGVTTLRRHIAADEAQPLDLLDMLQGDGRDAEDGSEEAP